MREERTSGAVSGRPLRVAFETLGCRSNYADSVELEAALAARGAVPCRAMETADVYVLNTCTVTDGADKEAFKLLRRARKHNPAARIVVTGCLAQVNPERILSSGLADAVIGTGRKAEFVRAVLGSGDEDPAAGASLGNPRREAEEELVPLAPLRRSGRTIPLNEPLSEYIAGPGGAIGEAASRARYHLRIQDGCDNHCTFCIVPKARGGLSSRPELEVLRDFERLTALGYQEIVLSGTHIGGYGAERGSSLTALLKLIAREKFGPRVRLSSLDPNEVSAEMIELLASDDTFCRYFHLCLQAFTDPVLKRMARRYRMPLARKLLSELREAMPECCLGSDVITGFPGETEELWAQGLVEFENLPLNYLHVFPYSEREGTPALRLDGSVALEVRRQRASRLRALSEARRIEYYRKFVGKTIEIIVETVTEESLIGTSREYLCGRSSLNAPSLKGCRVERLIGSKLVLWAVGYDEAEGALVCE